MCNESKCPHSYHLSYETAEKEHQLLHSQNTSSSGGLANDVISDFSSYDMDVQEEQEFIMDEIHGTGRDLDGAADSFSKIMKENGEEFNSNDREKFVEFLESDDGEGHRLGIMDANGSYEYAYVEAGEVQYDQDAMDSFMENNFEDYYDAFYLHENISKFNETTEKYGIEQIDFYVTDNTIIASGENWDNSNRDDFHDSDTELGKLIDETMPDLFARSGTDRQEGFSSRKSSWEVVESDPGNPDTDITYVKLR